MQKKISTNNKARFYPNNLFTCFPLLNKKKNKRQRQVEKKTKRNRKSKKKPKNKKKTKKRTRKQEKTKKKRKKLKL